MSTAVAKTFEAAPLPFVERLRSRVEGRERAVAMAGGVLAGVAFLVGTAATGMATGCVAPSVVAALDVATLI